MLSLASSDMAIYLVSILDYITIDYLLDYYDTSPPAIKATKPLVDL